ncbi:envelope protein [Turkey coronavirus]|uniref:Envelope small membrane protein n=1 Tax=Turkey enteric coronavirus TaxID=11152 RepID=B3FHU8_CVTKE|nr:envelope protein [Turkey coronavirus]ABW81430.1 envelope protein [Turkey coronavirus]ACV87239.1 envelope [Turkey coronavirus]ACV87273.1 envelope [Turkey coronavirus]
MTNLLSKSLEENGSFLTAVYIFVAFVALYLLGRVLQAFVQTADACCLFWYTWIVVPGAKGAAFVYNYTYGKKLNKPELEAVIVNEFPKNGWNNKSPANF